MRFLSYIKEEKLKYDNWTFPSEEVIKSDWSEFKKKEKSKWKRRSKMLNTRWPLFKDINDFKTSLKNAKVVKATDSFMDKVEHSTDIYNIDDLRNLVSSYKRPRNIDRIISGFKNNDKIPYPIILKSNNRYFIMAGNTRQNTAKILGITPKVLVVDVNK